MSRATEFPELCLFCQTDGLHETMVSLFDPLQVDIQETPSVVSEEAIGPSTDKQAISMEMLIPGGIDEEKAGFIRRLLPQIKQAREEIGYFASITIPNSLIVAQAALESGWGTSPGAKNRKNFFGLMRKNGQGMKFASSFDGVKKYMTVLHTSRAYRSLREQLGKTKNPLVLTQYLTKYCNCSGYSNKLNNIIRQNNLAELDQ